MEKELEQTEILQAYNWDHVYANNRFTIEKNENEITLNDGEKDVTGNSSNLRVGQYAGTMTFPGYYILSFGKTIYRLNFYSQREAFYVRVALSVAAVFLAIFINLWAGIIFLAFFQYLPLKYYEKKSKNIENEARFNQLLKDIGIKLEEVLEIRHVVNFRKVNLFIRFVILWTAAFMCNVIALVFLRITFYGASGSVENSARQGLLISSAVLGLILLVGAGYVIEKLSMKYYIKNTFAGVSTEKAYVAQMKKAYEFFDLDEGYIESISKPDLGIVIKTSIVAQLVWVSMYVAGVLLLT